MMTQPEPTGPNSRPRSDAGPGSVVALGAVLLRNLRVVVLTPLLVAALAVAVAVVRGPTFTASSAFAPQSSESNLGNFSGIAAQFGVALPPGGGGASGSIDFYADLVRTRALLQEVADTTFVFPAARGSEEMIRGTLTELYGIEGESEEEREIATLKVLQSSIGVQTAPESGIVRLHTSAPWPGLAEQINSRILDRVNEFDLNKRRSRATQEREFTERRMEEARQELIAAEERLQRFMDANRRYSASPELSFEYARLQRRVDLRQRVYTSLAESFEKARIEEVRNLPVVTVIDPPEGSARREHGFLLFAVIGLSLGGVIGIILAFQREAIARRRENHPEEFEELGIAYRSGVGQLLPGPVRQLPVFRIFERDRVEHT